MGAECALDRKYERKLTKYQEAGRSVQKLRLRKAHYESKEVSCHDFARRSHCKALTRLGFSSAAKGEVLLISSPRLQRRQLNGLG